MLKLPNISEPIYPDDIVQLDDGQIVKIKAIAIGEVIDDNFVYYVSSDLRKNKWKLNPIYSSESGCWSKNISS